MKAFFTQQSYKVVHIETALLPPINHHCELLGLFKSYVVLQKLQYFAQVLGLNFLVGLSSLGRREVKVIKDVLDLSDFVIFHRARFLIEDAEVFVRSS